MRITLLAVAMALFASVLPVSAQAVMQHYQLNIPRQSLDTALKDFAHQTGLQVARFSDAIDGSALVGPVNGDLSALEALKTLLGPSGLSFRMVNDRTIAIVKTGSATAKPADGRTLSTSGEETAQPEEGNQRDSLWSRFRLAQADQGASANSAAVEGKTKNDATSEKRPETLQEVIVTAQKREERLLDVPISMVILSADQVRKQGLVSIDDLASVTPGLSQQSDGDNRRLSLRGIANRTGNSPVVGIYLDEADVSPTNAFMIPDLATYDIERIEVLRGPQGTLYGDGSMGGTIRYITKKPTLNGFEFNADATVLGMVGGAPGQRTDAAINVPLVNDTLGMRVAGTFDNEGGWIDQPTAGQRNINTKNIADARTTVLWLPASNFTVTGLAEIHRNAYVANREGEVSTFEQPFNLTTTPTFTDNFNLYNLTAVYDSPFFRVTSTTSYIDQSRRYTNFGLEFAVGPPPTPPLGSYQSIARFNEKALTQELRLSSTGSGPWQWSLGGVWRRGEFLQDSPTFHFGDPTAALPEPPFSYEEDLISRSSAVFGNTSYEIVKRVTLGVGIRYFRDERYDDALGVIQRGRFHSLDPRFYVNLGINEHVSAYASAAKGFRSGGFNYNGRPPFGPEFVWTYELGAKGLFLNGHLDAEVATYLSHYGDYTINGILPPPALPLNITTNAGSAIIKGIESSISWRPADGWTVGLTGDYLTSRFTRILLTGTAYNVGDPIPNVVPYAAIVSAEREFALRGTQGYFRIDYAQTGEMRDKSYFGDPTESLHSDTIHSLNARVGFGISANLAFSVFAENLLNEHAVTYPLQTFTQNVTRTRPPTVGATFEVKY